MKQLFLTSSTSVVSHDLVTHLKTPPKGQKLAFINTAAELETGSKKWLAADRQALVDQGFLVSDYTITGKNAAQLSADLTPMDVIFVSGGNTFYLLQQAQKSGFKQVIAELIEVQGKPYIGSSAGSVIAAPSIEPAIRLDDAHQAPDLKGYQGFGLVNFMVFPHWGSPYFKELYLNKRLEHAYTPDQLPMVILSDSQYLWVEDQKMHIIDTHLALNAKSKSLA